MTSYLRQKIKTNLEYQGRRVTTDIPPYKTIKYIKELAKNLFYPINSEIRLIYQHKDITQYEQNIIGDFFKRKNQIYIKILTYSPQQRERAMIYEEEKKNQINKLSLSQSKGIFICSCKNDLIGNYCRNCKEFICNSCRINKEHENHRVTQVDIENLIESVKLYAITLQSEVLSNIKSTRDFCKRNEIKNNNIKKKNIDERHKIIQNKYDKIYEIYKKCIIDINPNNEDNNNADLILANYIQNTNGTNDDIEKILTEIYMKYTKQRRGMSAEDFNEYFKTLGQKEEELEIQSTDILAFRVRYELDEKMGQIYDKLEQVLDITLNYKIPLGLDSNSYYLYNIVKERKEKEKLQYENNQNEEKENEEEEKKEYEEVEEEDKNIPSNDINFKEKDIITSIDKNQDENNDNVNLRKEDEDEDDENNQKKKLGDIKNKNLMQNIEKNDLINKGVLQNKNNENEEENISDNDNNNDNNENENNDYENNEEVDKNNDYENNENNENNYDENNENNENNYDENNENENMYMENEENDPEKNLIMQQNAGNYDYNENENDIENQGDEN